MAIYPAYKKILYSTLSAGIAFGLIQNRYTGPEGYLKPMKSPGIAKVDTLSCEELGNHVPLVGVTADELDKMSVRLAVAQAEENNEHQIDFYYAQTSLESDQYKNYKATLPVEDLKDLQYFADSVCNHYEQPFVDLLIEPTHQVNAFAVESDYEGANGIVGLTPLMLAKYDKRVLKVVIGHELGHHILGHLKDEDQQANEAPDSTGITAEIKKSLKSSGMFYPLMEVITDIHDIIQKDALFQKAEHAFQETLDIFKNNIVSQEIQKTACSIMDYGAQIRTSIEHQPKEDAADIVSLEITNDPDAFMTLMGKGNSSTWYSECIKDITAFFSPETHPNNLDRVRNAQEWAQKKTEARLLPKK